MQVFENHSLLNYNTFKINAIARYFTNVSDIGELKEVLTHPAYATLQKLILGGGSNILFTQNVNGLVIKNNLKGITLIKEDDHFYYVRAGAGENWHQFVLHCIEKGYAGVENLSLIPGNVGASPMQNIGAYGVEIKDVFDELEALNIKSLNIEKFSNTACRFGYRESIFKQEAKNQYLITAVTYKLRKKPVFNTSYGAIEQELEKMGVKEVSIKAISQAVINIRSSKLPDPAQLGNAGSFFKNPVVTNTVFEEIKKNYPDVVGYKNDETHIKLAAGWLIEKCGWKGKTIGNTGVHKNQALVLVNYGGATGNEVYDLSEKVITSVKTIFGVHLEREVNII